MNKFGKASLGIVLVAMSFATLAAPVSVKPGSTFSLKMLKPTELNSSSQVITAAPTTCSSRTIMWSGAATCSAPVTAMANGSTKTITDNTGKVGSATVSCNAATNAVTVSGGSSCTNTAAGTNPCSSQSVSWGGCSATAPSKNHNQTVSLTDSSAPGTGNASFTCNDGVFAYNSGSCTATATACTSKALNWSAAGNACSALSGVTDDGANKTVSNTSTNGNTGSATFSCSAPTDAYSLVGSPTCAPPPPTECTSQTLSWTSGATSCSANSGTVNNGVTTTLASTNANSGSAQFTCNASANTYSITGTPSCAAAAVLSCTSQSKTWGTAPATCGAFTGKTRNNASKTISNTTSNGNNGSATYKCNGITNAYTVSGTPTCTLPVATECTSQTKTWGTAPANCSGVTGVSSNGLSKTIANTLNENRGSATYTCNSSTNTYSVTGTPTCTLPPPCSSQLLSWTSGGATCSAMSGEVNNGSSAAILSTNGNSGSAQFTCNASTNTYTATGTPSCTTPPPPPVTRYVKVSRGGYHTCGITTDGAAKCWGNNGDGELGDGTTQDRLVPTQVTGLTSGVTDIRAWGAKTCAIHNGAAKCWGSNGSGELGDGTTQDRLVPTQVTGLTSGVSNISIHLAHACAIHNGAAKCWGDNGEFTTTGNRGRLGDGTTQNRLVPTQVTGLTSGVTDIIASEVHSCAVHNGAAKCWGRNYSYSLGNSSVLESLTPMQVNGLTSGVTQIALQNSGGCALINTGAVFCWGSNFSGSLGNGSDMTSDNDAPNPVQVVNLTDGAKFIAGTDHSVCAILNTGSARCWGYNLDYQLNDGTLINRNSPVQSIGLTSGVLDISPGAHIGNYQDGTGTGGSCVIHNNILKCYGDSVYGENGDGTTTRRTTPTQVSGQ